MGEPSTKTLQDLVRHVGRYPEAAFLFVREALAFTVERLHGPETDAHRTLYRYLADERMDWTGLADRFDAGTLPDPIAAAIRESGGVEKLNRHVTGQQLCWGIRDYALWRWGLMARTVLESWNIKETADFGRIVFGFIDLELMQKRPEDSVGDFHDVFDFEKAFDESHGISLDPLDGDPATS